MLLRSPRSGLCARRRKTKAPVRIRIGSPHRESQSAWTSLAFRHLKFRIAPFAPRSPRRQFHAGQVAESADDSQLRVDYPSTQCSPHCNQIQFRRRRLGDVVRPREKVRIAVRRHGNRSMPKQLLDRPEWQFASAVHLPVRAPTTRKNGENCAIPIGW
jgi:hypothetical protein